MDKEILIFRVNSLLPKEALRTIEKDLKRQLDNGVIVTDLKLDVVKKIVNKNCECEIVVIPEGKTKIKKRKIKKKGK